MKVRRVLALGAHPDDVELQCGGTLILYGQGGVSVAIASLTTGDKGSKELSADETIRVRQAESECAAALIGAEYSSLGLSDSEVFETLDTRTRVIELLRAQRPDVIITHAPSDYHADHRAASHLVTHAAYSATSFKYATASAPLEQVPPVVYMDNFLGIDFLPEEYVDISAVIEIKQEMLRRHQSQFPHLQERGGGEDLLEDMLILARLRGRQCGVSFGEGFRLFRAFPHLRPQRLLP